MRRKALKRTVDGDVSYLVPPVNSLVDGKPTTLWTVPILAMERPTELGRVDNLIQFDKLHHDEKKTSNSLSYVLLNCSPVFTLNLV